MFGRPRKPQIFEVFLYALPTLMVLTCFHLEDLLKMFYQMWLHCWGQRQKSPGPILIEKGLIKNELQEESNIWGCIKISWFLRQQVIGQSKPAKEVIFLISSCVLVGLFFQFCLFFYKKEYKTIFYVY